MSVAFSDHEALLLMYKRIDVKNLITKFICGKYFLALSQLERMINGMTLEKRSYAKLDTNINYFIGVKLLKNLEQALDEDDKLLEKKTQELLKKETTRIINYTNKIKKNDFISCRIVRQRAKEILLNYMSEDEIEKDVLNLYPLANFVVIQRSNSMRRQKRR